MPNAQCPIIVAIIARAIVAADEARSKINLPQGAGPSKRKITWSITPTQAALQHG